MRYSFEEKRKFFDRAIELGYLDVETVKSWAFLPLEEFYVNGYMDRKYYHIVLKEIVGAKRVYPPIEEKEEKEEIKEEGEKETKEQEGEEKNKKTGKKLSFSFSNTSENKTKENKNEEKSLSISIKAIEEEIKEEKNQTKEENPAREDQKELIQEMEKRIESQHKFIQKLKIRSQEKRMNQFLATTLTSTILLLVLSTPYIKGILHFCVTTVYGFAAGFFTNRNMGEYATPIFAFTFVLNIISLYNLKGLDGSTAATAFGIIGASSFIYVITGRVLGETLRSSVV